MKAPNKLAKSVADIAQALSSASELAEEKARMLEQLASVALSPEDPDVAAVLARTYFDHVCV